MRPTDFLAFLSGQELLVVGVVILVLFGGAKIPQLMRGLGRGMGEFKAGLEEGKDALSKAMTSDDHSARPIDDHNPYKAVEAKTDPAAATAHDETAKPTS